MSTTGKTGRNDPCPCGSGEKFKRCCEKKRQAAMASGNVTMYVVIGALIAALILGFFSLGQDATPAGSRRVWSPEHGHYHNVP